MAYLKISNLYRCPEFLELFEEVWALEKIHGTSAHIKYQKDQPLSFFSGGEKYENFILLFDQKDLQTRFESFGQEEIIVFGEAYGGKQQGMRNTYGDELKFIAFDVKMNRKWLEVPVAETLVNYLRLDFVAYKRIPCTLEAINTERDADSEQAIRNGMGKGKMREGIVLRPIRECVDENGDRIITKHKRDEFRETYKARAVRFEREKQDPEEYKKLTAAQAIAKEWVTPMRLRHVIDKAQAILNNIQGLEGNRELGPEDIPELIEMMYGDIKIEGKGEFIENQAVKKAIGRLTALLFKKHLIEKLKGSF